MDIVQTSNDKKQNSDLLIIAEKGVGKKTALSHYPIQKRGGIGLRTARLSAKTGDIIQMQIVDTENGDLILISCKGQVIRLALKNAKRIGRATCGVRLMKLKENDKIAAITIVFKDEIIEEEIAEINKDKESPENPKIVKIKEKNTKVAPGKNKKIIKKNKIKKQKKDKKQKKEPKKIIEKSKKPEKEIIKNKETKEKPDNSDEQKISFSKKPIANIENGVSADKADLPAEELKKPKTETPNKDDFPKFTKRQIGGISNEETKKSDENSNEQKDSDSGNNSDNNKPNYWDANNWQRPKE